VSACPVATRDASPWQRARAFAACRPCVAGWAVFLVVAVLIVALYGDR
jgi:hypothetical protein